MWMFPVVALNSHNIQNNPHSNFIHGLHWAPEPPGSWYRLLIILTSFLGTKWEARMKAFELQIGTNYKVCTGINTNKEIDSGILRQGTKQMAYTVSWPVLHMLQRRKSSSQSQ